MAQVITVIGFVDIMQNNVIVRVYDDTTELCFAGTEQELASAYGAYLSAKYNGTQGFGIDVYSKEMQTTATLDIEELIRQDALAKLTQQERDILGV